MDTLDSSQCHYHIGGAMEFGAAFDPIHVLSSWNIPQRLEASTRLVADSVAAAKSGPGTQMDIPSPPSSSPTKNANFSTSNPLGVCGVMADFGLNNGLILSNTVKSTGDLQSLDSLVSATNRSYTDTSAEDDGIPMIFSGDAKSLWNIDTENAVSSCESAIYAFNSKPIDANDSINKIKVPVTETASHTSSHIPQNNPITSSKAKRYTKRGRNRALLAFDSSTRDSGFQLNSENQPKSKKPRSANNSPSSSNINLQEASSSASPVKEPPDSEAIMQMKELIYRAAAFRPVSFSTEEEKRPKRKNVRISTDPQTIAARKRRERISERIRVLQKLVPGGSRMDTASMLDEAASYLKFLRTQVKAFEAFGFGCKIIDPVIIPFNYPFPIFLCKTRTQ